VIDRALPPAAPPPAAPRARVPLIDIRNLEKAVAAEPLRLARLTVDVRDCVVLSGLDAQGAEMLMHLITGAAVPDAGDVRIDGRSTRDVATDTEWLRSLDRFGLVTNRAVLLEAMSVAANLALPLTLAIEPLAPAIRARVAALGREVGLAPDRLDAKASALSPAERLRVHLARALASEPALLLLEQPTAPLRAGEEGRAFGVLLRGVAGARGLGWLAVSEDPAFARASGGRHLRVQDGALTPVRRGILGRWFGAAT
jgi:ABC-type lipoprotein export system ATPase subunit